MKTKQVKRERERVISVWCLRKIEDLIKKPNKENVHTYYFNRLITLWQKAAMSLLFAGCRTGQPRKVPKQCLENVV